MDVRPHGSTQDGAWWMVSDLGGDVRRGVLRTDHVLGVGPAAMSLADTVVRRPVGGRAGRRHRLRRAGPAPVHARRPRRRRPTSATAGAALLRHHVGAAPARAGARPAAGSLLEPVAGERFDLIVAQPAVHRRARARRRRTAASPTATAGWPATRSARGWSRAAGAVSPPAAPRSCWPTGWSTGEQDWTERVAGWVPAGCDAWVWQREVADLGQYAALWLRDAGDGPARRRATPTATTPGWTGFARSAWSRSGSARSTCAATGAVDRAPVVVGRGRRRRPLQPPARRGVARGSTGRPGWRGPGRRRPDRCSRRRCGRRRTWCSTRPRRPGPRAGQPARALAAAERRAALGARGRRRDRPGRRRARRRPPGRRCCSTWSRRPATTSARPTPLRLAARPCRCVRDLVARGLLLPTAVPPVRAVVTRVTEAR